MIHKGDFEEEFKKQTIQEHHFQFKLSKEEQIIEFHKAQASSELYRNWMKCPCDLHVKKSKKE